MSGRRFAIRHRCGILWYMRWLTFFLLLYFATALAAAHLGQWSEIGYFHLEYLVLLGMFYALFADEDSAILAGFWCGLVYDLTSQSLLGTQALLLGLIALGLVKIRKHIFRNNALSQIVMTFLAVIIFLVGRTAIDSAVLWACGRGGLSINLLRFAGITFSSAVYTAVLAPVIYRLLFMLGSLLGFEPPHHRGISSNR